MRTAIQLTADAGPWPDLVTYVVEAERMGVDMVWVAEAWGSDAASPLGYLAARTSRMLLGSGVFQLGVRSAAMTAQTALTLAEMSGNRFALGLGTSGPQVMEGLHGVPFAHPLGRMRETLDVIRLAFAGERISADGDHLRLPLPDSEGKALRLSITGNDSIPIYLASMSPKLLELTGEQADGWLGTSFVPEGADAYFEHLRRGADRAVPVARRSRHLSRGRGRLRPRRRRAGGDDRRQAPRCRVQPRRDGLGIDELLQPGLRPPGLRRRRT